MNELALFAGAGGGILGGRLLGWRTRCAVEIDPYARRVLLARQRDGMLEPFPIWDDVRTFDGRPWRGSIDVVSGGFPCQDISLAGAGAGIEGPRSGLWKEFARIIGEVGPRFVFVENSPALTGRGLGTVLGDLATLGYNAQWGVLGAHHAGAPHRRDRIWIVANNQKFGRREGWEMGFDSSGTRKREQSLQDVADSMRFGSGEGLGELESKAEFTEVTERWLTRAQLGNGCEVVPNSNSERLEDRRQTGEPKGPDEIQRGMAQPQLERRGGSWWSVEPELGRKVDGLAKKLD